MSRLTDKIIVVTGASSGIGSACARVFVGEGARVILGDVNEEQGRLLAQELGDAAEFVPLDVGAESDWERAVKLAQDRWQRLDGIANIAGIGSGHDNIEQCSEESWRDVLRVNLDGVFLGTKYGIVAMKETGGGSIVNISSIFCLVSDSSGVATAYTASKGGVRLLSKSAAMHCAKEHYGIRVNTIHPGFIETPMVVNGFAMTNDAQRARKNITARHPIGRLGEPSEIGTTALYLLSDESAFVTGAEFVIDGGYTAV